MNGRKGRVVLLMASFLFLSLLSFFPFSPLVSNIFRIKISLGIRIEREETVYNKNIFINNNIVINNIILLLRYTS